MDDLHAKSLILRVYHGRWLHALIQEIRLSCCECSPMFSRPW